MSETIQPPAAATGTTHCTLADYERLYRESLDQPDAFWAREARRLDWERFPTRIADWSFDPVDIRWYEDGLLNLCHNAVDRHLAERSHETALIWEGDEPGVVKSVTYGQLHAEVVRMANCLKALGATKGDRVTIYLPMILEAAVAMLACARIGAVHSVVFGGFSPDALAGRIEDCQSRFLITADSGRRGGKAIPLKANVDAALEKLSLARSELPPSARPERSRGASAQGVRLEAEPLDKRPSTLVHPERPPQAAAEGLGTSEGEGLVEAVLLVRHTGEDVPVTQGRDHYYQELGATVPDTCPCEPMNAEDPLFILYTSGSTGKPKGVLHTTGGYAVWVATTFHYVFDYQPGELFWCSADVGWVTGHSYVVYGPLLNGGTSLMFEGVPNYPDYSRFWEMIERHKVDIFYTAPTAIRALMREGDSHVQRHDRSSLRLLGTVGEPINPEAWLWYWRVVGDSRLPIVDTWWQTETGGIMITTLPGAHPMKPGSAGRPFFGVAPQLVDQEGVAVDGAGEGNLCITASWPGQMRSVYGDHDRFVQTYFSTYRGTYFTGDGCRRDADGYYWITGRVDDVLNVSGHRLGTAEIESALVAHPKVAEAAVVGYPHDIKGQGIYAYVTLMEGEAESEELERALRSQVRTEISPIASPDILHFTPALPKTRSGKIMRRILRKIAEGEFASLGDTSTLADPSLVDSLVEGRRNR